VAAVAPSGSPDKNRKKYGHPEYDDSIIEALMRYFRFRTYDELRWFLSSISGNRQHVLPEMPRE
jgi:hypothetical protein